MGGQLELKGYTVKTDKIKERKNLGLMKKFGNIANYIHITRIVVKSK